MPNTKYEAAQIRASVSAFLTKLGVTVDPLWDDPTWRPAPKPEPLPTGPKRFRRTRQEMKELQDFTNWQLQRRTKQNV